MIRVAVIFNRTEPVRVDGAVRSEIRERIIRASLFGLRVARKMTVGRRTNLPALPLSTENTDRETPPQAEDRGQRGGRRFGFQAEQDQGLPPYLSQPLAQ